jgi:hypothetical protein
MILKLTLKNSYYKKIAVFFELIMKMEPIINKNMIKSELIILLEE